MGRNEEMTRSGTKTSRKRGRNKPTVITFSCIFCNQQFDSTNGLFGHMRAAHSTLCDIPQITADSEIVEEISGVKKEEEEKRIVIQPPQQKYTSEDEEEDDGENSVGHLIEMVSEGEDEDIESPPFERNSETESVEEEKAEPMDTHPDDSDDEDYLSLMEPICEINCNEEEAMEFQNKILKSKSPLDIPGESFFQCTICNASFTQCGELARHVRSHTLNKPYQCSICDKSFTHIGSLNTHLRIHRGEKPYKCDKCEKSFTQSSSLTVHLRSHLSKKPMSCQICDKGFMNAISLQLHMKSHQRGVGHKETYPCPECDKSFKDEQMLSEHVMVHSQNLYQCSICRLQLATGSDLVQHLKAHTGDKPFQCAVCNKSFTQPGSLSTHTRIHTGEKPHQCPDCDKSFTQASSLSVHMKIHSPEKPFWCHICERAYSQQAYFNKHMSYHQQKATQDEEGLAQCPLCNAVDEKRNLIRHFNKQHYDKKEKTFLCSICDVRYEDPQLLIAHVRVHFEESVDTAGQVPAVEGK